jgi:hypothetical protein
MKPILYPIFLLVLALPALGQYKYLSTFNAQGVPNNLTFETVSQRMLNNIAASLPESKPVPTYHPHYISNTETDVKLDQEGEVWITFVAEGAGYKNVLGYYTYPLNNPPASAPPAKDITIVFPNVSANGSGGGLKAGDQVYLGKFPANTGIGWVLIADGFKNGTVTNGNWILYSTPQFNPEASASLKYHNVLLVDDVEQKIVMGFEDIRRDYSSDNDFNDALFFITVSPNSAMLKANLNAVTESGTQVGTANEGGLESNGALASQIAQRQFNRQRSPRPDFDRPAIERAFRAGDNKQARAAGVSLSDLIPVMPIAGANAYVSTPEDLIQITNAKAVLAVDYFLGASRKAAILSTYTTGEVYNHTKSICDRLHGGSVTDIQRLTQNGHAWLLSQIQHVDLTNEYAICFSVAERNGQYVIEQHWDINAFPKADQYYNFQVWGYTATLTAQVAEQIVAQIATKGAVRFAQSSVDVPQVFVRNGQYKNGFLYLTIQNNNGATRLSLRAEVNRTETAGRAEAWTWQGGLTGNFTEQVKVPIAQLFDAGLSISNPNDPTPDVLYLADSPWGISTTPAKATVERFEVQNESLPATSDNYVLERKAIFNGTVTDEISLFKFVKVGGQAADMTSFGGISFVAQGQGIVEVVLVKKSIHAGEEQYRAEIKLSADSKPVSIPYSDFRSVRNKPFVADDLTVVVFSFLGNGRDKRAFSLGVSELQFIKKGAISNPESVPMQINVYPNPATTQATATLTLTEATDLTVTIYTQMGQVVWQATQAGQLGENTIALPVGEMATGLYVCQLQAGNKRAAQKLVVNR